VKQDCNHFGADKNPKSIIPAKQACNHLGANANPEATILMKQAYNHFVANKNPKSTIPPKPACNHFGANANPVATIPTDQSFAITNQQCHQTVRKSECIKRNTVIACIWQLRHHWGTCPSGGLLSIDRRT
jgi:hypothetical protein